MSRRTVLVTGGAGYLGTVLCDQLLQGGYRVRCLDRLYFGREPLRGLLTDPNFELVELDLRDPAAMEALSGVDAVVHLAGLANDPTSELDPDLTWSVNHLATVSLAQAAIARGIARFVHASSCSVYGRTADEIVDENSPCHPVSTYAQTKLAAEADLLDLARRQPGFAPVSLRQATLFGLSPRMRFDLALNVMALHAVRRGRIDVLGGGAQWRPLVHVADSARAFVAALEAPADTVAGEVLNVGASAHNFRIADLAGLVAHHAGPCTIGVVGEDPDHRSYRVDFARIERVLGWRAEVSVAAGAAEVAAALRSRAIADPDASVHYNVRTLVETPVRTSFLPFSRPQLGAEEEEEVIATLRSGWLTAGPRTQRFERLIAQYVGARHAVAVSSCTAALHLALIAAGVGPGDEVITSPITWPATANVIVHCGASPVFADVEPDTLNLDPARVAETITPRTKVIIPVHMAGQPCDMGPILALARKRGIRVIEDAAHALGASYRGQRIGTISDMTCFSFYPTKNVTTIEGGVVTTDNDDWAEAIRTYSLHGMSQGAWKRYTAEAGFEHEVLVPGYKYNFTDIQAALGLHQIGRLDGFIAVRRRQADYYDAALADLSEVVRPVRRAYAEHAHHLYIIQLELERLGCTRAEFAEAMKREGIGTGVHFRALHVQHYYRERLELRPEDLPQAARVSERVLSLPLYPLLTERDQSDTVFALRKLVRSFARQRALVRV